MSGSKSKKADQLVEESIPTFSSLLTGRVQFTASADGYNSNFHALHLFPLELQCTNKEAETLLQTARNILKDSTAQSTEVLHSIIHVTSLLWERERSGREPDDLVLRKISEARLTALMRSSALRPSALPAILQESARLLETDPDLAPSRLQRASVLFKAKKRTQALYETWYALLIANKGQGRQVMTKGLAMLGRCQRQFGRNGIRLDVAEVHNSRNIEHLSSLASSASGGELLTWDTLTTVQRERHHSILKSIPIDLSANTSTTETATRLFSFSSSSGQKLPRFFSWITSFLAVSSTPRNEEDIAMISNLGVTTVITLTLETPLPPAWFSSLPMRNVQIFLKNMHAPSIRQTDAFLVEVLAAAATGGQILLHCGGGKGRAGTMLAAYLMLFNGKCYEQSPGTTLCSDCLRKYKDGRKDELAIGSCASTSSPSACGLFRREPVLSNDAAISFTRALRPGSIESTNQERFLQTYTTEIYKRFCSAHATAPASSVPSPSATDTPLRVIGILPRAFPDLVVLSGLPGAGKSFLAASLLEKAPKDTCIVSQDILGNCDACEAAVSAAARASRSVIVDRVNALPRDRSKWLAVAFQPRNAVVVHVGTSPEIAASRAESRVEHPTLAPSSARQVVKSVARSFVVPGAVDVANGFSTVLLCDGDAGVEQAVVALCGGNCTIVPKQKFIEPQRRVDITKYPRTRHIFNLGGCGRDDIVLDWKDAQRLLMISESMTVTIEEKVDGANVGFSIDATGQIVAQNRSHYIDASSHLQFRSLQSYIRGKDDALRQILRRGVRGRILYGEWMYAVHSVRYNALPSAFLAFDLWDVHKKRFLSRESFWKELKGSGISTVPILEGVVITKEGLKQAVSERKSALGEGTVEGVVVRVDEGNWLREKGKVIRADFIPGNEHWSRSPLERNGVVGDGIQELYG